MQRRYLTGLMVLVAFALGLPLVAQAVPVGRFVQVEGSVDLMKGGKFPAVPAKVQDEVEQGDAVRTKSLSKAQIRFVDDTVLAVAPESRVAIDEYVYDATKSKRQATVEIFRGVVHFVVSKILQTEKPDFIMKTHTGVLGVRGTGWYAQLTALDTDIYNEQGTTEVQNLFPEVPGKVTLTGMQFTRVGINLPPTLPMPITQEDLQQLRIQFSKSAGTGGGGTSAGGLGTVSPLETGALGAAGGPGAGTVLATYSIQNNLVNNPINNPAISLYTQNNLVNNPTHNPLIPPAPAPGPSPPPPSSTYSFTMDLYGYRTTTPTSLTTANAIMANWGQLTGVYPEYFTTSGSGTRSSTSPIFTGTNNFTASDILSGTVSGISGQSLTGTFSATGTSSTGYSGTFSGPITINPNGTFSYSYTNLVFTNGTVTETGTGSSSGTPGTYFSQTAVGSVAMAMPANNTSGNQQTITNNSDSTNGTYPIWGTRTGVSPGTFSATMNMVSTAPVPGYYPPADQGSLTASMQGVVSGPAGGTGVMTTIASGQEEGSTPYTFAGPVTINPTNGSLTATFYGTNTDNNVSPPQAGIFTQTGSWSQTKAIPVTGAYSFSIPLTDQYNINPTSTTTASLEIQGVGTRTGVYPGTYLNNVENGTLTGPSGSFTVGNNVSSSVSGTLSGTVTGVLGGYTLTGTGTFTSSTSPTFTYTGPITITPGGKLIFNYTGTVGTLTAAGTMTEYFGIPVSQSALGTYQALSGGSNPALMNTSQMTGTQTIGSASPANTNASVVLTYGNGFSGLPTNLETGSNGTLSVSGTGAVFPWYGGQPTNGLLSSTVTVDSTSVQTAMQVTYNPTNGNLIGQVANGSGSYGPYINAVLAATPTSGYTTTSLYQTTNSGSYTQTSSSPYSTGLFTASGLTGTMLLGGSGAIVTVPPITAGFNFNATSSQANAFPASSSGTFYPYAIFGAVIGPAGGNQNGYVMASADYTPSGSSSSYFMGLSGPFTLGPASATPPYPGTLTVSSGNGTSPNGYPMSVSGTWTQSDPPASATQTVAATWAAAGTGLTSPAQAWWLQRAAWLASPSAATAGAGANAPLLSTNLTRLTGTSLGSRIQRAAQLTQPGTPGNPALAANLQAAWRFRHLQRLAALRAASGATPGGRTSGNPAGPILALQRH